MSRRSPTGSTPAWLRSVCLQWWSDGQVTNTQAPICLEVNDFPRRRSTDYCMVIDVMQNSELRHDPIMHFSYQAGFCLGGKSRVARRNAASLAKTEAAKP